MKRLKKFVTLRAGYADTRVVFQDEMRLGTRTQLGRKYAPSGHRPLAEVHIGYLFVYLYVALCPFSGQIYAQFAAKMDQSTFQHFIEQINTKLPQAALLIADGAKSHQLTPIYNQRITLCQLPPACPELNSVERFFQELRRHLKFRVFLTLEEAQRTVETLIYRLISTGAKGDFPDLFPISPEYVTIV